MYLSQTVGRMDRRPVRRSNLFFSGLLAVSVALPALAQERPGEQPRRPGQWGERGGQGGGWGMGGGPGAGGMLGGLFGGGQAAVAQDVFRRDLVLISRELQLDRVQQQIVELLLMDYEAAFGQALEARRERMAAVRQEQLGDPGRTERVQAMRNEMRDAMRALRESRREGAEAVDPAAIREQIASIRERMTEMRPSEEAIDAMRRAAEESQQEWLDDRSQLFNDFLANVQLILNEQQAPRWDPFERSLRRERLVSQGTLAGEAVDLFVVLREAGISGDAMLDFDETLTAYAMELDDAMKARSAILEEMGRGVREAIRDQDMEMARRLLGREAQARVRVRDINDRFADQLEADILLVHPENVAESFRSVHRLRAYPRIYSPTPAQRAFDAAKRLEELDGRIVADLMELRERYGIELSGLNQELLGVLRREEPQQNDRRLAQLEGMFGGERPRRGQGAGIAADPIRQAFTRRDALDERYLSDLKALIGDDLYAQLPLPREAGSEVRELLVSAFGGELPEAAREWLESDMGQRMMERFGAMLRDGTAEVTPQMIERLRGMIEGMQDAGRRGQGGAGRGGERGAGERGVERAPRGAEGAEPRRRPRRDRGGDV
jgi:G:T/U-mismatch repair DNA glycosylase